MRLSKLKLIQSLPAMPRDMATLEYILPDEVLAEIMSSHKANSLSEVNDIIVSDPPNNTDWPKIAYFINNQSKWNLSRLTIAYNWYLRHTKLETYQSSPFSKTDCIRVQTQENPEALTPIMLYCYCYLNNITVGRRTSSEEMLKCLEYYFGVRPSNAMIDMDPPLPATFYARLSLLLQEYNFTADDDARFDPDTADNNRIEQLMQSGTIPEKVETNEEAIVAALFRFKMNLYESDSPIREYLKMEIHYKRYNNFDNYKPITETWQDWRRIYTSETLSPDIRVCFGPTVHRQAYSRDMLYNHAQAFGLLVDDQTSKDALYERLVDAHSTDTFYPGKSVELQIYGTRTATITETDLDDLDEYQVVSFGEYGKPMLAFECTTLDRYFLEHNNFYNPADVKKTIFSDTNIRRLKHLAKRYYPKLYDTIVVIMDRQQRETKLYQDWVDHYRHHENCYKIINELHRLAMHCRGWQGEPDDLPIANRLTYDESIIDVPVSNSLIKLYDLLRDCPTEMREQFLELPTFNYQDGKYSMSSSIKTRLDFIQDPNDGNLNCTRYNSNYFAVSSYILANTYGKPLPYDIRNFRQSDPIATDEQ